MFQWNIVYKILEKYLNNNMFEETHQKDILTVELIIKYKWSKGL